MASRVEIIFAAEDKASGTIKTIKREFVDLGKAAEKTDKQSGGLVHTLSGLAKVTGGIALGGVAGLAAGLGATAIAGLKFNNSMEQATARINAFTGDADETAKILEMVRDRASRTPFAFEEMAAAAASLGPVARSSGVDLETLISKAEILAASNPAQGFEGAVLALKEATGGDWTSIVERFDLPRQRLKELADQGVPAVEAITTAMSEMGLNADLVSNMANTAAGRWSTLVDTFTTLASTITAPIFEGISTGMGGLQVLLDANMPKLQAFAGILGEKIGGIMSWLASDSIPGLVGALGTIGSAAAPLMDWLQSIAPPALQAVREAFGLARDSFTTFRDALAGEWHADPEKIHPLHEAIGEFGLQIRNEIIPALADLYASLKEQAPIAWQTFKTSIQEDVLPVLKIISDQLNKQSNEDLPETESKWVWFGHRLETILNGTMTFMQQAGRDIRSILKTTVTDLLWTLGQWEVTLERWESAIETMAASVISWFDGIAASIVRTVNAAIAQVNRLISAINSIPAVPNIPSIPTGSTGGSSGFGGRSIDVGPRVPLGGIVGHPGGSMTSNVINIDARGATDPRGVEQGVRRALDQIDIGRRADIRLRTA